MNYSLVVCISLALLGVDSAHDIPRACNSLKPATIDYAALIRLSPFYAYRGNVPSYKCIQSAFVGPAGDRTDYSGNGIVIQGNYTFSFEITLTNNTLLETILCSQGIKANYQVIYSNFKPAKASVCATICNPKDPTKYEVVLCVGRTSADEEDIDRFLSTTLRGVKGVENLQSGCPKPQHCKAFTN